MNNIEYLYNENKGSVKLHHLKDLNYNYYSHVKEFGFGELNKIIKFISSVEEKFRNLKFVTHNLYFQEDLIFADKLTYILFECFMYDQIINKHKKINLFINRYLNTIYTEGVAYSCLRYTNNLAMFKKKFLGEIYGCHFRRIIEAENNKKDLSGVSVLMGDITQYLKNCGLNHEQADQVAEIVVELVDNALEHSSSDCLIDIDVSDKPYHQSNNGQEVMAVNIVVVNFANKILGIEIKNILESNKFNSISYKKLSNIRKIHESYFNKNYGEDQFYIMSSFQNKISSRKNSETSDYTGGTGLTKLIERLQESSVSNICYVVSGDNCLVFINDNIKQDKDKWVGFNKENNFEFPPDENALKTSPIHILGTAYNLTFIFKKEQKYENN